MPPLFLSALEFGVVLLLGLAYGLRIRVRRLPRSRIPEDRIAMRLGAALGIAGVAVASTNLVYDIIALIGPIHH